MPEESKVTFDKIIVRKGEVSAARWKEAVSGLRPLSLESHSKHTIEMIAATHSTAFLRWTVKSAAASGVQIKFLYSEGYEQEPRDPGTYPFFRNKGDRLDSVRGKLIGPCDVAHLLVTEQEVSYEPFWFRTFRIIRVELDVGSAPIEFGLSEATQVNYPMNVIADFKQSDDLDVEQIWEVSIRTMRNCMFDGYSDCPFYEQLQ